MAVAVNDKGKTTKPEISRISYLVYSHYIFGDK
jgi:hypothetical protein